MTTTTTATKLLCPECRRENEPERVYCHDCGTRLDRSAVRYKKEPIQDTHKRVKRMFDPTRAKIRAWFFTICRLLLGAGVLAAFVDLFLPPDVPPPDKKPVLVSSVRFDLESMATKHQPSKIQVNEETANGLIASVVKSKHARLDKPLLQFSRGLVTFQEGRCSVTAERLLFGYWSVYTTCGLVPELKNGRLTAKIESGRVGRLPIHPKLAKFMGVTLSDLAFALDSDLRLVAKVGAIDLHDKNLTLTAVTP